MLNSSDFFQVFNIIFITVAIWAIIQSWCRQSKTLTIQPVKSFIHLLVWYQCYLLFPIFFMLLLGMVNSKISWLWGGVGLSITFVLFYARFIEPNCLKVEHRRYDLTQALTEKKPLKIALIADLHIGLFSGSRRQIQKIVQRIEAEKPDIVVVAGDWTYEPRPNLAEHLEPFKQLSMPIYSVNGNHDETYPGPPIQNQLKEALLAQGIIEIEQKVIEFDAFRLVGVGDLWAGKADMQFICSLAQDKPWIIVSHNPDTVAMVPNLPNHALMLSGHTHGGQVEIPWFTTKMMQGKSTLGHKRGLYQHQHADVFVTVGTGMVGVPFRFRVKPTIDLITVY